MDIAERKSRQRKKKLFHELFALRMDLLYKLSVSNHFRGKTFWNPNNLDFRGRVYPIAPHCSHIGNSFYALFLLLKYFTCYVCEGQPFIRSFIIVVLIIFLYTFRYIYNENILPKKLW